MIIKLKTAGLGLLVLTVAVIGPAAASGAQTDMSETLKRSLVHLLVSSYGYDSYQPWKHKDVSRRICYGCAVGEYQVLTTARNATDASFIEARCYGQNEYVSAEVKVIDYESNLCLLQLDRTAMDRPLEGVSFSEDYEKGAEVTFYRLSSDDQVYSGRGYIDRARVTRSTPSYAYFLQYIVNNVSEPAGSGQIYCRSAEPIGIGCWSNENEKQSGAIAAVVINRFLADACQGTYEGFGSVGFAVDKLLDPARRAYLKMPDSLKHGVYVRDVYHLGTGSDVLQESDVILAIDGHLINPFGRYTDDRFERIFFEHLITNRPLGDTIVFDIWRAGRKEQLSVETRNFSVDEMLVPYYEHDRQPEYIIIGGFVLQKLTRQYLAQRGDDWPAKVSPHLYHYYRDLAFKPTDQRRQIIILSYVLPAQINMGYQNLHQLVVSKFNGKQISTLGDVIAAQQLQADSKYHVIEFENDMPLVVLRRDKLAAADALIARRYGISKLVNVGPQ